jgi:hypothetical protein
MEWKENPWVVRGNNARSAPWTDTTRMQAPSLALPRVKKLIRITASSSGLVKSVMVFSPET